MSRLALIDKLEPLLLMQDGDDGEDDDGGVKPRAAQCANSLTAETHFYNRLVNLSSSSDQFDFSTATGISSRECPETC